MPPVVAIVAPGMMGAAVASCWTSYGVTVLTSLAGRSANSVARADAANMSDAPDAKLASADFVLSIVPPGDALSLARRLAPALLASNSKPIYVDCNAISPQTADSIAAVIKPTGSLFVDAGIFGAPPRPESKSGTRFYASGPHASAFAELRRYGLDIVVIEGPIGAASALKLSFSGITKGTQAIGGAMMLAAERHGVSDILFAELEQSQSQLISYLRKYLQIMPPKASRWISEMHEIEYFVSDDASSRELYSAAATFYRQIARDFDGAENGRLPLLELLKRRGHR